MKFLILLRRLQKIGDCPDFRVNENGTVPFRPRQTIMSNGLSTTFQILSKTENESAVRVLLPALDSPQPTIQDGALAALLTRHNTAAQTEILRRTSSLSQRWKYIIQAQSGRLTGAMRDAVLGHDEALAQKACTAAVMFSNFDLIPTLLTALESPSQSKVEMASATLMKLIDQLCGELSRGEEGGGRSDLQWIHKHVLTCLETSMQRYGRHNRREVIEAFLYLTDSDNVVLNEILENPHHVLYLVFTDTMSKSSHGGITSLLLNYLDKPQIPSSVMSIMANRCDVNFIREFLCKVGVEPSPAVCQNLKRMVVITWLRNIKGIVNSLSEEAQHSLVVLATASGISREQIYTVIEYVLLNGKPAGRREAVRALADFNGSNANALALKALNDADSQVQANVITQLRHRGIPGIMQKLVEKLDSPHHAVRQAAREALSEFSFKRFLGSYETLDESSRKSSAELMKKVDQQAIPLLCDELQSPARSKRLRGLEIVKIMNVAMQVEEQLICLLQDDDHIIRAEAATILGGCRSRGVKQALQEVAQDESSDVREAAQSSFEKQV
jgi:hypothetical protein